VFFRDRRHRRQDSGYDEEQEGVASAQVTETDDEVANHYVAVSVATFVDP